jgi:hypothetical protein
MTNRTRNDNSQIGLHIRVLRLRDRSGRCAQDDTRSGPAATSLRQLLCIATGRALGCRLRVRARKNRKRSTANRRALGRQPSPKDLPNCRKHFAASLLVCKYMFCNCLVNLKKLARQPVAPICDALKPQKNPSSAVRLMHQSRAARKRRTSERSPQLDLCFFCISARKCSLCPLGMLSDFHSAPFQCLARNTICPA